MKKNTKTIIFPLNNNEHILMELGKPLNKIDSEAPLDRIPVKIFISNTYLHLTNQWPLDVFYDLKTNLESALNNKIQPHSSIKKNLGYLWNQDMHGDASELIFEQKEKQNFWVGLRRLLWSSSNKLNPKLSTWLYNDQDGNIILELTPSYRWHFAQPKEGEEFITYEQFMATYQSYLTRIISKEVAERWIAICEEGLAIIPTNV